MGPDLSARISLAALCKRGHDVVVLDNLSSGYVENLNAYPQIRFIEGDVRDPRAMEDAIKGSMLFSIWLHRLEIPARSSILLKIRKSMQSALCEFLKQLVMPAFEKLFFPPLPAHLVS